ncbi:MAG: S-methyl-5-thioribose-1-phosphate isomerase [Nanoarchaeota archaeon]|nr:S-methyl-5-thioribose-1-phosphate isomerase [Nanoarchaeota archaeon]
MIIKGKNYRTVWMEGKVVRMINQPLLPHRFEIVDLYDTIEVHDSIKNMIVRGAPAIGATAAYAMAQAALKYDGSDLAELKKDLRAAYDFLSKARPTAQDLFDGLDYVYNVIVSDRSIDKIKKKAIDLAEDYAENSIEACEKIGEYGSTLIKDGFRILTHCNAGALATVDYGTALAPIRTAHYAGKKIFVYADETRPRSQGSRLTAFELVSEGIPHAIIADNAAGYFMKRKEIDMVIVGSDRTAMNGDVCNKIGTYEKALLAYENKIPFYVAIPLTTIDRNCPNGEAIPIEERSDEEVLYAYGWNDSGKFERVRIAPEKSRGRNPAFDVTPAKYVTGLITPKGIIKANKKEIERLL